VSNIRFGGGANGAFTLDDAKVIDDGLLRRERVRLVPVGHPRHLQRQKESPGQLPTWLNLPVSLPSQSGRQPIGALRAFGREN
jgi:hypothetical protein